MSNTPKLLSKDDVAERMKFLSNPIVQWIIAIGVCTRLHAFNRIKPHYAFIRIE